MILLLFLLLLLAACAEVTDNSTGFMLIPGELVGGLPQEKVFTQAVEVKEVASSPLAKGYMTRIFVGQRGGFEMRALLDFIIDLPEDAEIVTAVLRFYVVGLRGELPVNLSVHLLEKEFEENEVTYLQASDGVTWNTPGGDFMSSSLGTASFEGEQVDTVSVELDEDALNSYFTDENDHLPLIILSDNPDSYLGFVAREYASSQAVASRLDLTYKLSGGTSQSVLERRAYKDATVAFGEVETGGNGYLTVGEFPSSQVFFAFNLDSLPTPASVNQAYLYLSIADMAIVDTFHVAAHIAEDLSFVSPDETFLGSPVGVGTGDSLVVVDVSLAMQQLLIAGIDNSERRYLVITSYPPYNIAGFLDFYPIDNPVTGRRPYLRLIYTDAPDLLKPED